MSTAALSNLIFLQIGLEVILALLLLILWRRTKKTPPPDPARLPENLKNSIETFLAESEKIAAVFEQNLKDKKELSADLILKLDRRLSDYQNLLNEAELGFSELQKQLTDLKNASETALPKVEIPAVDGPGKANPAAPEVRALVLQLAKKGHRPEEIAAKARLHLGEVELIIDLERQFNV